MTADMSNYAREEHCSVLTTINADVPPNTGGQPNTVRPWYYVCTIHCVHVYYTYDRNVRNQLLNIIIIIFTVTIHTFSTLNLQC